ncbi:MAG TPA: 3-hydroxyacyl-CoA dehydrogenase NAD-binding domain-containing protein [Bacteroidota bacterium]|nr:3-hydroxyacyl-CoA dehydrogenase NAD-binding domain-containing protein [Bacteroidota bacterium]
MATNVKIEDILQDLKLEKSDQDGINTVAVVGLGVMGQGIAQTIAAHGIEVVAIEKTDKQLAAMTSALLEGMDREIQRWTITKSEKNAIASRIHGSTDFKTAAQCNIIIEAVDENFELKRRIFADLDEISSPETIFVSNTSTLNLSKLASATKRPDKVIGMHFLNPVPKIPVVELVRGLKTSDTTFQVVKKFAERLGKTAVEVFEYPGFVTTRLIVPLLNEAMHALMEGVSTAEGIDTAMKLGYNFQYGPLELADMMGLDEVLAWMESLFHELGEAKYRPCPILRRMVREGKLGRKSGEGFYKYTDQGKRSS